MARIETTVEITPDRRLVLDLPGDTPLGRCDVVLLISRVADKASQPQVAAEPDEVVDGTPLRREGSVLVYAGVAERPHDDLVATMREERIQKFVRQATGG